MKEKRMGYTTLTYEQMCQRLQERGPLGPVLPEPRRPSLEEVHTFSVVVGVFTTLTPGVYDVGIWLNEEEGVWIYAAGLSYHEMLDVYSQYSGDPLEEVLEHLLQSPFVGYYRLPALEENRKAFPPAKRCQTCSRFHAPLLPHACERG